MNGPISKGVSFADMTRHFENGEGLREEVEKLVDFIHYLPAKLYCPCVISHVLHKLQLLLYR